MVKKGEDTSDCTCPDPLIPTRQEGVNPDADWDQVQQGHVQRAVEANDDVDVVFFGDSITEGWNEVFWDIDFSEKLGPAKEVYNKYFSKENGAKYEALPLGIAGDTVRQGSFRNVNTDYNEVDAPRSQPFFHYPILLTDCQLVVEA